MKTDMTYRLWLKQWKSFKAGVACVTILIILNASYTDAQQEIIDEIREYARQKVGPNRLGVGYAAMINFAVNPDISTATYKIQVDSIDDPYLKEYRLPLRHDLRTT